MTQSSEYGMKDEFVPWLEDELGKGYASFSASPAPAGAPYRAGMHAVEPHRFPGGRAVRAAIVVAVAAIGLMGTTALAAAAVTGSANPQAWGRYVTDAVSTCKSELASGQHGIGECVRAIARQKGAQERDEHSSGNGSGHAQSSPKGRPSSVGGSPSSRP
jgi:hypothetical protein